MNFLIILAILPLSAEWSSLTMSTRQMQRMASATTRMMMPATVSDKSPFEKSASPEDASKQTSGRILPSHEANVAQIILQAANNDDGKPWD